MKRFYKYSGAYVKSKIDELSTKWHSSRCYLKYYPDADGNKSLGLTVLEKVAKDDMVALYSESSSISEYSHNLRHCNEPNCYVLNNGEVFASSDLEPSTELTLDFNSIRSA